MLNRTFFIGPPVAATLNSTHPLARGLVAGWLFNEGRGGTVHDVTGRCQHGSASGDPVWTPSRFGPALTLDGADDWLSMGDCLDMGADDMTVLVVVAYNAANQPDEWFGMRLGVILGKGPLDYAAKGYGLFVETDNTICWELRDSMTHATVVSDSALNDGQHHIVIGVCDRDSSSGLRLYIDGVQQSDVADPTVLNGDDISGSSAFAIGARQEEASKTWYWDFDGSVACAYVWRRVLTDAEICALQCNPYLPLSSQGRRAPLLAPTGKIVTLAGSITGQSGASATLRAARNLAGATGGQSGVSATLCAARSFTGSAGATASLSANLRAIKTLSGTCAAQAGATATLTIPNFVSLSGTINATSRLTGILRIPFVSPSWGNQPSIATPWLREALFQGMTSDGFKLGTALTQGWFWMRRAGCSAIYRGASQAEVNFQHVLSVVEAGATQAVLPSYLPHEPAMRCCYVMRRFNACGYPEQTTEAAVAVRIGPDGRLVPDIPNAVFSRTAAQREGNRVRLTWFYCPLDQSVAPTHFHVYSDGGTGPVSFDNPLVAMPYEGRRFYSYRSDPLVSGVYRFIVRAVDATGTEETSLATHSFQVEITAPQTVEILAATIV
jgi:hypothetical protein